MENRNRMPKRLLSLLLAIVMLLGMVPTTVFAAEPTGQTVTAFEKTVAVKTDTQIMGQYVYEKAYTLKVTPSCTKTLSTGAKVAVDCTIELTVPFGTEWKPFKYLQFDSLKIGGVSLSEITFTNQSGEKQKYEIGESTTGQDAKCLQGQTSTAHVTVLATVASDLSISIPIEFTTHVGLKDIPSGLSATYEWDDATNMAKGQTISGVATIGSQQSARKVKFVQEKKADGLALNWPSDLTLAADATEVTLPWTTPQAEGYTFKGWSTESQNTAAGGASTADATVKYYQPGDTISVTGDTALYAVWEEVEYTITYAYPTTTTPAGAWFADGKVESVKPGESASFTVKVYEDYDASTMVVTANGQPLAYKSFSGLTGTGEKKARSYYYEFVPTGDTAVVMSIAPSKLQYTVTLPTSEKFEAKFTDPDDAKDSKIATVDYDYNVHFTVMPKNSNWVVKAVYANGAKLNPEEKPANSYKLSEVRENITVTMEMDEVVFHTVHYVIEGAEITASVAEGSALDLDFKPATRLGHTFVGWYSDAECTTRATESSVTGDVYLYGRYQPISATIKFAVNEPETNFTCTVGEKTISADKDIPAVIKLYGMAVQLPNTKLVDAQGKYTFKGWALTKDGDPVYQPGDTFSAEIMEGITLYAVWEINQYQISFNAGPGFTVHLGSSNTTVKHGDDFEFSVIVDEDHRQDVPSVWANVAGQDGEKLSAYKTEDVQGGGKFTKYTYTLENVTADTAINILADNNETYTVTYYYGGLENDRTVSPVNDDVYLTQNVIWNETATQPVAPTVEGYEFLGWYVEDTTAGGGSTDDGTGELPPAALKAPLREAVTIKGYTPFDFTTPITDDTEIYAMFRILEPTVTFEKLKVEGKWEIINIKDGDNKTLTPDANNQIKVPYGTDVQFTLAVNEGFDYSSLALAANGYALTKIGDATVDEDGRTLIPFKLTAVKTNPTITVTGIVRKQITVTYYANAMDDVAGIPGQEKLNYYVATRSDNSNLNATVPSRVGYEFKGWATVPAYWNGTKAVYDVLDGTTKTTKDVDKLYQPGDISDFTADTNLYAVWAATELDVTLKFVNPFYHETINGVTIDHYYEGDTIHLQAALEGNTSAQGTFTFYRQTRGCTISNRNIGYVEETDASTTTVPDADKWVQIGEPISSNGGKATLDYKIADDEYLRNSNSNVTQPMWWYRVVFTPANEEGYAAAESAAIRADTRSRAIAWAKTKNDLTIYPDNNGTKGTTAVGSMTANNIYWLQISQVKELKGARYYTETKDKKEDSLSLKAGVDYVVEWQYQDTKNDWVTYTTTNTDDVKIEAAYSGYVFRALVRPTANGMYTKAGSYDQTDTPIKLIDNQYKDYLISQTTPEVDKKNTVTVLHVADEDFALTEANDVVIHDATPFGVLGSGSHVAQYEDQQIELVATVTKENINGTRVETGSVEFYRVETAEWSEEPKLTLLGTVPVTTAGKDTGVAKLTVTMKAYDTTKKVEENVDQFKAVYVENETYKTSYKPTDVYIKSADFKTPIVDSTNAGTWMNEGTPVSGGDNKKSTTYEYDLSELEAGLTHTFTLRQNTFTVADGEDKLYSVVALDGREVKSSQYTIAWYYTTGDNTEKAIGDETNPTYTTSTNKDGDSYFARLTAVEGSGMRGEIDSKLLIIGKKQDVKVTVEADDAIAATTGDGFHPDVYQLNEITLRAWVDPAKETATKLPKEGSGVCFFYMDGDKAVSLGEATLQKDTIQNRMFAELKTKDLPVNEDGTMRDVTITAVYYGDESFNPSKNWVYSEEPSPLWSVVPSDHDDVTTEVVTVYSSVVFNCTDENKTTAGSGDFGIHISKKDGSTAAHENGVLELGDIYTLDASKFPVGKEDLRALIAKLESQDFTIEWQMLKDTDTSAEDYADETRWETISGKTEKTLVLTGLPQDTAYRAKITVRDTARVQGSYQQIVQDKANADSILNGRHVYYSNVITTGEANSTVSVSLNTSKISGENTEGITEGEIVTANVFVSGATSKTPEGALSVSVQNDSTKGNLVAYSKELTGKNTVNGWNDFEWDTKDAVPGYYTMTVTFTSNVGYKTQTITRSLLVRESTYSIVAGNTNPTYNGQTQGVTVELKDFDFNGTGVNDAAKRSWTVKYYDKDNKLVEPVQAGTYTAEITLPASAYWTEETVTVDFTIAPRTVSIADVVAQGKVYDGTTKVNLVEVILNDAETDQSAGGTGLPTGNTGVLNGDSIYATAIGTLGAANAGTQKITVNVLTLGGDDKGNYKWDGKAYSEEIYVSRSQVYGTYAVDGEKRMKLKQGEAFPAEQVIKMIDQSGREIELGTGKDDYTLTFYYHSDTKIKQTATIRELGLYTVIARPNQSNYKGGVEMQFEVVTGETEIGTLGEPKASTLITISNTVDRYDARDGVTVTLTNSEATVSKTEYQNGTSWSTELPQNAGRYLVKVTASTGDVAYGIYTVVKVNPTFQVTTTDTIYNSMEQDGDPNVTFTKSDDQNYYITYTGDVAIGGNEPKDGNVDEQAPVNAGTYTVTVHTLETTNYAAHEISESFIIEPKKLTITVDSWQTTQYGAFPDFTASYSGFAALEQDKTPDVWTRDVQIAPEFLVNQDKGGFSNDMLDQVGTIKVQPVDALAKNYTITYVDGQFTKQREDAQPTLAIHGVQDNNSADVTTVYYGDVIQLYPYGTYNKFNNGSSIFTWSVEAGAPENVTIDQFGILRVNGVGEFTVKLTRGEGTSALTTTRTFKAVQKEVQVVVAEEDKVYNGAVQTYSGAGIDVFDMNWFRVELESELKTAIKGKLSNTTRQNIGTQIVEATAQELEYHQYRTYGGPFSIHDKDATVAPVGDSHIYGNNRTIPTNAYTVSDSNAFSNGLTASQTDVYTRLDVHDGYEILVAGTENMNYNVKYVTDQTAEDSAVTTYAGVKLYSTTTKAKTELNDTTVYGDSYNVLDWILVGAIEGDTLADFNIADENGVFVAQDYDNCVENAVTYKAANRVEGNTSATALAADRTATDKNLDANYELNFKRVENTGAANYQLKDAEKKNAEGSMTPPTGTVGFIGADSTDDNLIEGSANIAQRPVSLSVASDVQLYWHLPQDQMYQALMSVIAASNLAPGHTVEDLDLTLVLTVDGHDYTIDPTSETALNITSMENRTATVKAVVGDTNYKLTNDGGIIGNITLKTIQIEATYTTKTFTNFTVLIKAHAEDGTVSALTSAEGLSYKIFKKTGDTVGTTVYASGTLTYTGRTQSDGKDLCGVFTASYAPALPKLGENETYYIQMYEYGVPLVTSK